MNNKKTWCAVHTIAGFEQKVTSWLTKKNIESYCPLKKNSLQYGSNKAIVNMPLFPQTVFIYAQASEHGVIQKVDGVICFLFWLAHPAVIQPEEVAAIKYYLRDGYNATLQKIPVNTKDAVEATKRSLTEVSAAGFLVNTTYIEVNLPSLGYMLTVSPCTKNSIVTNIYNTGDSAAGLRMA